jgi:hypothetical protein
MHAIVGRASLQWRIPHAMDLVSPQPFWPLKNGLLSVYPSLKSDVTCDVTAHLYRSRKEYRSVCQRAGKSGKQIEPCVISTFQSLRAWLQRRLSRVGALAENWRVRSHCLLEAPCDALRESPCEYTQGEVRNKKEHREDRIHRTMLKLYDSIHR